MSKTRDDTIKPALRGSGNHSGDFTMPGEAGHENLTLRLAKAWGADTIRDSDGTELSRPLLESGMAIYSTICLVRSVNEWAARNQDKLQQCYLMSFPVAAVSSVMKIPLLEGFSTEQFRINEDENPKEWWQVHDRTSGMEVSSADWSYRNGTITITHAIPGREYTANFLVYRIWEEISMYNHITNGWGDRERAQAVEPAHPETQEALLFFLEEWLREHPNTNVVRFTSLFYNFAWLWGADPNLRFVYSDWGSYTMSVNPCLIRMFEAKHGYRPQPEDFIAAGRYNSTHNPPSKIYREWMEFVHGFVVGFGRRCVDLVHKAGKKAFLFYDDHWIGAEPYSPRFREIGFDGIIKCVFSAFEVRLCAGVPAIATHEIRLHPYLFPTGLKGEPTFSPGGHPERDAWRYWMVARRALLRTGIDRIGLGGYSHLVEPFPEFIDCIAKIADEFRSLKALHRAGKPWTAKCRVGILTAWGALRSWSCSGHMHEHPELDLINVLEALSGLPFDIQFLSFEDIRSGGALEGIDVIINAGAAGSAWSGGSEWADPAIVQTITTLVCNGGGIIGVGEPSALPGALRYFRLASALGVDKETGDTICAGKRQMVPFDGAHFIAADFSQGEPKFARPVKGIYPIGKDARSVFAEGDSPLITVNSCGFGRAVYFAGFDMTAACKRLLHRALLWAGSKEHEFNLWTPSSIDVECAYFPALGKVVLSNNSDDAVTTEFKDENAYVHKMTIEAKAISMFDIELRRPM